jgi:transcriptional regulator with XRE-family HTH domain
MKRDLGARLTELRATLGLTQKDFAEKIRVAKSYISSLEKSQRKVNVRLIKLVADTFGVNEEWLQSGTGGMFVQPKDEDLSVVVELYNQLHPELQKLVIKQLEVLLKISGKLEKD